MANHQSRNGLAVAQLFASVIATHLSAPEAAKLSVVHSCFRSGVKSLYRRRYWALLFRYFSTTEQIQSFRRLQQEYGILIAGSAVVYFLRGGILPDVELDVFCGRGADAFEHFLQAEAGYIRAPHAMSGDEVFSEESGIRSKHVFGNFGGKSQVNVFICPRGPVDAVLKSDSSTS
ncbi:hypothetical protein AAF712_008344 [Marasmius tenuissimus]|uniref:Uncharacterized protein n=1 Tax=Marasmius tenuissimus TaxID=585030 RepID=A0ABR2ZSV8_9AGAR